MWKPNDVKAATGEGENQGATGLRNLSKLQTCLNKGLIT